MPFTFKLSKRLALLKASLAASAAALALACDRTDLTGPQPFPSPLTQVVAPLPVLAVVASGDDGNVPQNTRDDDLGTRWSASGDGQWIRYDLGAPETIDRVDLAWYVGDTRIAYFDIQVSPDTVTWTQVFSGQSSGKTREPERYDFPAASGRYVRIVGHGNSTSAWNSITEVDIYGTTPLPPAPLPPPVASVTVSPDSTSLVVDSTVQLTATLKDSAGNVLSDRAVTWASSSPGIATVSATDLVAGVAAGTATITATSEGQSGTATVSVTSGPGQVTYYSTNFTDGTTGPLDVYAYGGGSCAPSTDYTDPGSAYSMKCTIPAGTGAAALQAWFGRGQLAGTPQDPSVDQDLYQQVRFVLGPGAAASIGGTSCTSQNPRSQFKTHKSVYGQVGSNTNGWVMSEIAPCTDGEIGMFSEAEMWGQNGTPYPWPGTYPSLNEGTVYDVVYRYHRYPAQNCGTIAMWVNGTKVLDSPCWSYMGTTGGSSDGLLFWDGATYLQDGLGALTVYTLFTRATNYPIGAAAGVP